ncbi:MAG TPA: hypothetical protein VGC24_11275, partial [Burkholderiaceae bacterium]
MLGFHLAHAVQSNVYPSSPTSTITSVGGYPAGLNVDPATRKLLVTHGQAVDVFPAGGTASELAFTGVPGGSSPVGAVRLADGSFYVGYYWYNGRVDQYSAAGAQQAAVFSVNASGNGIH